MDTTIVTAGNLNADQAVLLRQTLYNATVTSIREVTDELRILRVTPDGPLPPYQAGQYTSLGLGYWEPRVEGVQSEQLDQHHLRLLAKRAYSVCCPLWDPCPAAGCSTHAPRDSCLGQLVRVQDRDYLEFYVALVRTAQRHPPALTPRLFALQIGDRLFLEPHFSGTYTLEGVAPHQNLIFFSTGTGEAPHNAMVAESLSRGHAGRIVVATCVRRRRDLAYEAAHRELERRYPGYQYFALTTREPENLDPAHPNFVGKRHLQHYVDAGDLERDCGIILDPQNTHVFLCGSPAMIGVGIKRTATRERSPQPGGMLDILLRRGFQVDDPHRRGNVHFERFW